MEIAKTKLTLVCCYIHPSGHWDPTVLVAIRARTKHAIVFARDFNAHSETWGDSKTDQRGKNLQQTIDNMGLRNTTAGTPTFIRAEVHGSVIDLTLTSPSLRLPTKPELDSWGSDHVPIIIGKLPKSKLKTCHVVHWDKYRALLDERLMCDPGQLPVAGQLPSTGPKTVKLFINQPRTLGFDQALGMEPVQLLELSANDLEEGAVIPLRYVKFQNVQNLQIFVKDNQSGSETTRINYLVVYGSPINTTNMGEFKRVAGKKGESH
ncbi:thioredoxin-like protein 1 [Ixodes scapularis]